MNKPNQLLVYTIIALMSSINTADAQLNLSKWQVGVNGGVFIYQGDLTPSQMGSYRTPSTGFGFYISRILNPSFILRTNVTRAKLKGYDGAYQNPWWRKERNFKFSTPVTEISELVVWNIFGNNNGEADRKFSPYIYAGAGVSILKISRDISGMSKIIFHDGSEVAAGLAVDFARKTPTAILVLPAGVGVEYSLTPHISLTAEAAFRYTFTDYLDGFSQSANPKRKDFYHSYTIGMVYKFGKKNKYDCPAVKN